MWPEPCCALFVQACAEIGTLGPVGSIKVKMKIFWYASRGQQVLKLGPRTYGKHQGKNENLLVCQQGPTGAEIGTPGPMGSIRVKMKTSSYASRGQRVVKLGP